MMETQDEYSKIWDAIQSANHVTVTMHTHPDGDALGSALGLYHTLLFHGVKVAIANATAQITPEFNFLSGFNKIKTELPQKSDLIICCDSANAERIKFDLTDKKVICFDHHISNTYFGDWNIDAQKASTAEVVYDFIRKTSIEINRPAAQALYAGIASDSRFFTIARTSKETFAMVSELIDRGVDPAYIADQMQRRKSLAKLRLNGYVLTSMELFADGRLSTILLDIEIQKQTGAQRHDTDEAAELMLSLVSVEVSMMVLVLEPEVFKISLRSKGRVDVNAVIAPFNGGGHANAAGAVVESREEVDALRQELIKQLRSLD